MLSPALQRLGQRAAIVAVALAGALVAPGATALAQQPGPDQAPPQACQTTCPGEQKNEQGCCPACSLGKQRRKQSAWACCWEGQSWDSVQKLCVGVPTCPLGMPLKAGLCSSPQTDIKKLQDIRAILTITGSAKMAMGTVSSLIGSYKALLPQVPTSFWAAFEKEFDEDALMALVIPAYDKHMTHEDIKALLTFYQSPAGRRYVQAMPDIQRDSRVAGQRWGLQNRPGHRGSPQSKGLLKAPRPMTTRALCGATSNHS